MEGANPDTIQNIAKYPHRLFTIVGLQRQSTFLFEAEQHPSWDPTLPAEVLPQYTRSLRLVMPALGPMPLLCRALLVEASSAIEQSTVTVHSYRGSRLPALQVIV